MKTRKIVFAMAVALAGVATMAEQSCIVSGSTNSVPDSVAWSTGTSLLGAVPVPSPQMDLEGRYFTWSVSQAIDILTDKLGSLLFLR